MTEFLIQIYLDNPIKLYLLAGLITWLLMIQGWKRRYGSMDGIEERINRMVLLSLLGWPYSLFVWVFSWPVFRWKFWTRAIPIRFPRLPELEPWRFGK